MRLYILLLISLYFSFADQLQAQDWLNNRENWNSIDSVNNSYEHSIEYITIHHGGEIYADDRNTVEYLQNLQTWSRNSKNWIDVPYHYIVDRKGKIFEGRPINYRGDTNTTYDPTGHALIVLLGNFEEQPLLDEQIASLKIITAQLAKEYKVPRQKIKTHKDYAETLCPGKKLSDYLMTEEWQSFISDIEEN